MKKILFVIITILSIQGCGTRPKNFTYYYKNEPTGLQQRININGYYVCPSGCDSSLVTMFMFYSNGLFTIATAREVLPELIECFEGEKSNKINQYPLWGTYRIDGDIVRTQTLRTEGNGFVIFKDYRILPDKSIINISDYVEPQYSNLGYLRNYPSFKKKLCENEAAFYPSKAKRDSTACPFLKKKWFSEQ